jgi:hypothetical protein
MLRRERAGTATLHRIVIDDKDSHSPSEIIATACVLFRGIVAEVA